MLSNTSSQSKRKQENEICCSSPRALLITKQKFQPLSHSVTHHSNLISDRAGTLTDLYLYAHSDMVFFLCQRLIHRKVCGELSQFKNKDTWIRKKILLYNKETKRDRSRKTQTNRQKQGEIHKKSARERERYRQHYISIICIISVLGRITNTPL